MDRLKELIQSEDSDLWDYKEELITLIDEAIARQSATSEEVQEAIAKIEKIVADDNVYGYKINNLHSMHISDIKMVLVALQAYQSTISKTETIGCDDLYSQCGECGQIYLENRGYDYCPYCGRRLED